MGRIFKEPLFQFICIGIGLFLLYGALNTNSDSDEIIIDDAIVNEITAKFDMQWKRDPTMDEITNLIDAYLDQEVMYREALNLNLDHDDEIIKRRLSQKMQFLSDDFSSSVEPDQQTLLKYYEDNQDKYTRPAVYTFQQIYFSPDKRNDAWKDAQELLKKNRLPVAGDQISLADRYTQTSSRRIGIDFGLSFAASLDTLPLNTWTGPVRSGLGIHLVLIEEKVPSGYYSFEEVSDKVALDYNYDASKAFQEKLITGMMQNYSIHIEVTNEELQKVLREKF